MVAATNLHNGTVIRKIVTDLHDDGQVIWATGLIDKCSVPAIAAIELTDDRDIVYQSGVHNIRKNGSKRRFKFGASRIR